MNLYKISRTDNVNYDEYISCVVAASSPQEAVWIHPSEVGEVTPEVFSNGWADPVHLKVEFLGVAAPHIKKGVIVTSNMGA